MRSGDRDQVALQHFTAQCCRVRSASGEVAAEPDHGAGVDRNGAEGLAGPEPKSCPTFHRGAQPWLADLVEADLVRGSGPDDPEPFRLPYVGGVLGVDVDPANVAEAFVGIAKQSHRAGDVPPTQRLSDVEPMLKGSVQKRFHTVTFQHRCHVGDRVGDHSDRAIIVAALQDVRDLQPVLQRQERQVEGVVIQLAARSVRSRQ
jgi:hypothetical protein